MGLIYRRHAHIRVCVKFLPNIELRDHLLLSCHRICSQRIDPAWIAKTWYVRMNVYNPIFAFLNNLGMLEPLLWLCAHKGWPVASICNRWNSQKNINPNWKSLTVINCFLRFRLFEKIGSHTFSSALTAFSNCKKMFSRITR